jgi:hypothetical protein
MGSGIPVRRNLAAKAIEKEGVVRSTDARCLRGGLSVREASEPAVAAMPPKLLVAQDNIFFGDVRLPEKIKAPSWVSRGLHSEG